MVELSQFSNKPTLVWNNILRKLGYNSFSDKKGLYIICGEQYQAVFLTSSSYKVVGRFMNKKGSRNTRRYLPPRVEWGLREHISFNILPDAITYFDDVLYKLGCKANQFNFPDEESTYKRKALQILKDNRNPFMYVYKNIDNILKGESNKFITITNKDEFLRSMNQENIKEFRDIMDKILQIFNKDYVL